MNEMLDLVRRITRQFVLEFIDDPYLCYTEHGLHALFFTYLFNALSPNRRFTTWNHKKVSVIQKEYPTAGNLGKPQRQHWDIAVIKTPPSSIIASGKHPFDYLRLSTIVEFGMNESEEHLVDDIDRICHPDSNVDLGIIVHLYRLSKSGAKLSGRDWPAKSKRILTKEDIAMIGRDRPVEIYFGLSDSTGTYKSGAWLIYNNSIEQLQ